MTPSSSPLHGRKKMTCCTQILTVRLSDTHWGGLHTSWVHWPLVWRAAMAIVSGSDLQKNHISHLCSPDARPTGCARFQKDRPICPQHGRGSQDDCNSRATHWKKTYDIVGGACNIVCKHTMSVFTTTSSRYVTRRYRMSDIRYRMSRKVHTMSYTICSYVVVCTPPTISYVFLNLRYLVRYVFLVTYDISYVRNTMS